MFGNVIENELEKHFLVFGYVIKNDLENNLLIFFFSSLLKEWKSNLIGKKFEGGWN